MLARVTLPSVAQMADPQATVTRTVSRNAALQENAEVSIFGKIPEAIAPLQIVSRNSKLGGPFQKRDARHCWAPFRS